MRGTSQTSPRDELRETRALQHWVREYARNRSLPVLLSLAVFAVLFLGISVPSYLGGVAYRAGNFAVFALWLAVAIAACGAAIFLAIPNWGGLWLQRWSQGIYAGEGTVTLSASGARRPRLLLALALLFALCILAQVVLGVVGYLPDGKFMQPISAVYVVPFLVTLHFFMRPVAGPITLLWPLLYALHAVLILAGAPIVFAGRWESLNMLIPTVGYGIVTSLLGHLYSRWALHQARGIVTRQLDRAELEPEGDEA